MRAVLLMNERAGTVVGRPDLPARVEAVLRATGIDLLVIGPDAARDMGERLERAVADGAEVLVIGGGDGTLRAAAERLAGTGRVLAPLPFGTLNLLCKDLGLPTDPLEAAEAQAAALRRVAGGEGEGGDSPLRRIDLGEVNGVMFACQSVIGLPNAIGRHRQMDRGARTVRSWLRIALGAMRTLLHYPPMRLAILAPGERPKRVWAQAISVVNNPYEEGVGRMFRRPRLDGGVLAVYRPRRFGLFWGLRMLLAMALGRWRDPRELAITLLPALGVRSRRRHLRVMNDGEMVVLNTPLQYRCHPGALRVLAPVPGAPGTEGEVAAGASARPAPPAAGPAG